MIEPSPDRIEAERYRQLYEAERKANTSLRIAALEAIDTGNTEPLETLLGYHRHADRTPLFRTR